MLRAFMLDPVRAYYQRQLETSTGLPIRAVQRELERLSAAGLLYRRAEGNRAYFQVNTAFPLYPELRNMILKTASEPDRLRGSLACDPALRLLFLAGKGDRALAVTASGSTPGASNESEVPSVETMAVPAFLAAVESREEYLDAFLVEGVDLLGRREDVVWRHIEAAGYTVAKGEGVP